MKVLKSSGISVFIGVSDDFNYIEFNPLSHFYSHRYQSESLEVNIHIHKILRSVEVLNHFLGVNGIV